MFTTATEARRAMAAAQTTFAAAQTAAHDKWDALSSARRAVRGLRGYPASEALAMAQALQAEAEWLEAARLCRKARMLADQVGEEARESPIWERVTVVTTASGKRVSRTVGLWEEDGSMLQGNGGYVHTQWFTEGMAAA